MLMYKMTINLSVLCPLMKDSVMCNLNSTAVVTRKGGLKRLRDTQISQETTKPKNLSSGMSHSMVLSLGSGTHNNSLFLARPRNQEITKKHGEARNGLAISEITSSIKISIRH
ncbi:hypothetical protein CsSME_00002854 [Camellia sinensis var. sinensis]